MRRTAVTGLTLAAALTFLSVGCGGSGGNNSPTKAEFVRRADAICGRTDGRQRAAKRKFWVEHPGVLGTPQFREEEEGWRTDVVEAAVLPQVKEEAEEIGRLPTPSGDRRAITAIVKGLERAVHRGEAEPVALVGTHAVGPFGNVMKLARRFGLKDCAEPL